MKLYTQIGCAPCETAKKIIKDKNLDVEIIHLDLNNPDDVEIASDARIRSSPTLDADKRYIGGDVVAYLTNL